MRIAQHGGFILDIGRKETLQPAGQVGCLLERDSRQRLSHLCRPRRPAIPGGASSTCRPPPGDGAACHGICSSACALDFFGAPRSGSLQPHNLEEYWYRKRAAGSTQNHQPRDFRKKCTARNDGHSHAGKRLNNGAGPGFPSKRSTRAWCVFSKKETIHL